MPRHGGHQERRRNRQEPWQRITPKEIVGIVIAVAFGFVTGLLVARPRSRN